MQASAPVDPGQGQAPDGGWFPTTHWTVVLNTASHDTKCASQALAQLCQTYWGPVNTYIRSRGRSPHDADDLTQQFFTRFLHKEHYRLADRNRGRFRTFLLTSVERFLVNEWKWSGAQKRGGGQTPVSLEEFSTGNGRSPVELADENTAERDYDRSWALTLLNRARERVAASYAAEGRAERFHQLEQFLPGEDPKMTYTELGAQLGVAEGTIKADVHRLRRRYREVVRDEIASTVSTPDDIDDELQHLVGVLSRG